MSKTQISNERRDKNKEKKRRKRFFLYFFGSLIALVFILGLTISPALGAGSSSNKIKGKGVNLEGPVVTDPEDDRKESSSYRLSDRQQMPYISARPF